MSRRAISIAPSPAHRYWNGEGSDVPDTSPSINKLSLALRERVGVREPGDFCYRWQVTAASSALTPAPLPEGEGILKTSSQPQPQLSSRDSKLMGKCGEVDSAVTLVIKTEKPLVLGGFSFQ
jgi:hypothetical protein